MSRRDSPSVEWHKSQKHVDTPQKTRVKTLKSMGTTSTDIFKKTEIKQRTQVNIISSNTCHTEYIKRERKYKIDNNII